MKPIIGIFLGETAGVGPELVAKLVADKVPYKYCRPVLIGDARVLRQGMEISHVDFPFTCVESVDQVDWDGPISIIDLKNIDPKTVKIGTVDPASGKVTGDTLVYSMVLLKQHQIDGFVFGPLNKQAFKLGGYHVEDEHVLFAQCLDWLDKPRGILNVMNNLWTFRVTTHIPFRDVPKYITKENVLKTIELTYSTMKRAGYDNPRIALAALNPHAGEGGLCGTEEIDVLAPVVQELQSQGKDIVGPVSADTIFMHAFKGEYDAVVTLYHDQGQIATKLLAFDVGVTVAGGLPYAITTPEHGTAFDIAGKGIAKPSSFEQAIRIAAQMSGWREQA